MGHGEVGLGEGLRLRLTVRSVMLPTSFSIGPLVFTGLFCRLPAQPRQSTEEALEALWMFGAPFEVLVLWGVSCGMGGPGDGALRLKGALNI